MQKRLAVVIGRFQPVHKFHTETLLRHAIDQYDEVLVLLGSSQKARTWKDPLRWEDRECLIRLALVDEYGADSDIAAAIEVLPIKDYPYSNNRWVFQVQRLVDEYLAVLEDDTHAQWSPTLVGVDKDDTTFYLRLFPQWESDTIEAPKGTLNVSATEIRRALFENSSTGDNTSPGVRSWLIHWLHTTDEGRRICDEYHAAQRNRLVLAHLSPDGTLTAAPYPQIFHTTDSVVLWRGHVLLIRRRSAPGKGLWALPGGHLDANEWIRAGAVRERQEETKVRFYHKGARRRLRLHADWCRAHRTFDHPGRSLRGRTITDAFLWVIPDEYEVEIEAADDAAAVQWRTLYEALHVMDYELFEDHQAIVAHFALGAS